MRNYKWTRIETLLALDLFLQLGDNQPDPRDTRILELSRLLRLKAILLGWNPKPSFRSPAAIVKKLSNLGFVSGGDGLSHCSQLDRDMWQEYGIQPEVVGHQASKIRMDLLSQVKSRLDAGETFERGPVLEMKHWKELVAQTDTIMIDAIASKLYSDRELLIRITLEAIAKFLEREGGYVQTDVNERSICARLAMYFQGIVEETGFNGYWADVENNRKQGGKIKTILDKEQAEGGVTPWSWTRW